MVSARRIRLRRRQRGSTVLIVVMVTTLITGIGVFALRNMSQMDQAVGFARQSGQATALVELGTSAALSQIVASGIDYAGKMSGANKCLANGPYISDPKSTCYRLGQDEIERTTFASGGVTLLQAPNSSDSGSFGPYSGTETNDVVSVELTDKFATSTSQVGAPQGSGYYDVTVTGTATIRPTSATECSNSSPALSVKRVLRAHTIIRGDIVQAGAN